MKEVIRYVVTHIDRRAGARTLAMPMQGRFTYDTPEKAQAWIDAAVAGQGLEVLGAHFGLPLEVRPVACWPGHYDPKTIWFEDVP